MNGNIMAREGEPVKAQPRTLPAAEINMSGTPKPHASVPGLYCWVSANTIPLARISREIRDAFNGKTVTESSSRHGRRRMSDCIECGASFTIVEKENRCSFLPGTARVFPTLLKSIAEETAKHRGVLEQLSRSATTENNDHHLNVVIRRYRPGQSIGFHVDRVEKFEDHVWSLIVAIGDSTDGLQYEVAEQVRAPVSEVPGLVTVQTGLARRNFKHGVPTVKAERISVTWRWYRPEYLTQVPGYNGTALRKEMDLFTSTVRFHSSRGYLPEGEAVAASASMVMAGPPKPEASWAAGPSPAHVSASQQAPLPHHPSANPWSSAHHLRLGATTAGPAPTSAPTSSSVMSPPTTASSSGSQHHQQQRHEWSDVVTGNRLQQQQLQLQQQHHQPHRPMPPPAPEPAGNPPLPPTAPRMTGPPGAWTLFSSPSSQSPPTQSQPFAPPGLGGSAAESSWLAWDRTSTTASVWDGANALASASADSSSAWERPRTLSSASSQSSASSAAASTDDATTVVQQLLAGLHVGTTVHDLAPSSSAAPTSSTSTSTTSTSSKSGRHPSTCDYYYASLGGLPPVPVHTAPVQQQVPVLAPIQNLQSHGGVSSWGDSSSQLYPYHHHQPGGVEGNVEESRHHFAPLNPEGSGSSIGASTTTTTTTTSPTLGMSVAMWPPSQSRGQASAGSCLTTPGSPTRPPPLSVPRMKKIPSC